MQTPIFDVNTMLNDLALFDQSVVNSAANMKMNFDMQTAGISQSFTTLFQSFDETAAISAANFKLAFCYSLCSHDFRTGKKQLSGTDIQPMAEKRFSREQLVVFYYTV